MLNWLWGLLLLGAAAVPPTTPPAVVECLPGYTYTHWEQTREERKFEGAWVVAYKHYPRTRAEVCTRTSTNETKVEGPFQLWPATPYLYVESVSVPKGDSSVSGAPLRSTDAYSSGAGQVGPKGPAPAKPITTETKSAEEQPSMPIAAWLLAVALGWLIASRRRMGLGGALALASLLAAVMTRSAHADTGAPDYIRFDARLGPIPERPVVFPGYEPGVQLFPPEPSPGEPVTPPTSPGFELPWFSQAVAYVSEALKRQWMPLVFLGGSLAFVFGKPWKWVRSVWSRITGARPPRAVFKPLWADGEEYRGGYRVHTDPGLVTPATPLPGICEAQDPIQVALDRGFSLEAVYYYGPAFWRQAVSVEYQPWEIEEMNRLAANGLAMGWSFQDVDRADEELAAIKAFVVSFVAGSDAYEGDSTPEFYGAVAGDSSAGFVAYGDLRDLLIQGYKKATGQEVNKATLSLALVGLLMELGWADGFVPDPADGANALVSAVKARLKKMSPEILKVFAEVAEGSVKAADKKVFYADVQAAIEWASRNPKTADDLAKAGKGLDDFILIARNTPKVDSEKLAKNMLAQNSNLVPRRGYAAHHIVAGDHPGAEDARRILEKFDIDINAAENGVFLPGNRKVMNGEAYHPTLHTRRYFEEVNERLRFATTKEEVLDELQRIVEELSRGKFPR